MTDEQRLQATTEMLILVRDNLFRGMSKSIQKLQARSINEVLELPNYTESPQRKWQGLTDDDWGWVADKKGTSLDTFDQGAAWAQARLKERNG
jgi:hypothetical protein